VTNLSDATDRLARMSSPATAPEPNGSPPPVSEKRHVVPALIALLVLCLLTALVWWRAIARDSNVQKTATCTTVAATQTTSLPEPSYVTLAVYNSTSRTGLASKTAKTLKKDGFQIPDDPANDPNGKLITGVAEIRYGPSGADGAKLVAFYVPGATMVPTNSEDSTVVLSLGKGFTALATPDAVQTALQAQGISLVKPKATVGAPATPTCTPSPTPTVTATVTATATATASPSPSR
jgi:hypothetical protein